MARSTMQDALAIHANITKARDSFLGLFKDEFYEKIKPYKVIIQNLMDKFDEPVLQATLRALRMLEEQADGETTNDKVMSVWILATAAEMIEPSKVEVEEVAHPAPEPQTKEHKVLTQSIFEGQPPLVDWCGVDYDGLLSFGSAYNPRTTEASGRWRGFQLIGPVVAQSGFKPGTSLRRAKV